MEILKVINRTLPKGGAGKLRHRVQIWNMTAVEKPVPGSSSGATATDESGTLQATVWMGLKPMKDKTAEDVRNGVEENVQYYEFTLRYRDDLTTQHELREPSTGRVFEIMQLFDGFENKGHLSGVLMEKTSNFPEVS